MNYDDWAAFKIENFIDVSSLIEEPVFKFEHIKYNKKGVPKVSKVEANGTIVGNTFSRYNYPKYKYTAYQIKNYLEELLEDKFLYTYHYDRFYYHDSVMHSHVDRPSCEISVSLSISSNVEYDYPLYIESIDGETSIVTSPGDAIVYQGTKYRHRRDKLIGNPNKTYYHQAFFHYVRADGYHVEHAWDPEQS